MNPTDAARTVLAAKLELAAELGLQAKFNYTHDGSTRERRLVVEDFDGEYVSGESYNEAGRHEGYRQFRLDRIEGSVVIR